MNAANARFSGSIKALSGTFEGDVTAGTTTINAGGITGSAAGGFRMGNEGLIIGGGSINLASAFIATSTGQVTGSKMLFKGGSIGGWQVAQTYLVDGSNNLKFEPAGTYIISSSMFKVSAAGNITASNMEITQATIRGGTAANWIGHSSYLSFVGGGTYNVITGSSFNSVIGAGAHNMISQSSDFSSILSGMSCSIKGNSDMSFIGAGISNQIISSSNMSFIGSGEGNKILYASQSGIVTGEDNRIEGGIDGPEVSLADAFTSKYSFIGGGISNKIYKGQGNSILSGQENLISGSNWSSSTGVAGDYQSHCTIGGGKQNKIYGQWSYSNIIAGGLLNKMYGDQISDTRQSIFTSTIGGGTFNSMYVGSATGPAIVSSVICGGVLNNINNGVATGFIGGGSANKLTGPGVNYAVIVGGRSNQIIGEGGEYNSILGGYSNEITSTGDYNGILGGYNSGIGSSYTDTFIVGSGINADASNTTFVEALKSKGDITAFWSSDIRLKDNIRPIEGALFKVKQIRGIEFEWNDKLGDRAHQPAGTTDIGVVAQDVQKVLPNIVKEREDGWLGVRYERMIPLLLEAIKEQQTQIETLEARIKNLEGKG